MCIITNYAKLDYVDFIFFLKFGGIDGQVSIFENKLNKNLFIEFEHWSIGKAILQRMENINDVIINNNFS